VSNTFPECGAWQISDIKNLIDEENGVVDPRLYTDRDLYDLELERIFGRSWLFLAHESQFEKHGDFITTTMGDDPIVVVKQRDGSIKAFLNQCRHRGMRICRYEGGNARSFTCSYHGWAYDIAGKLVNVPFEKEAYGHVDKEKWSPRQVPRVESYKGLIFGNWDAQAPDLATYLGEAAHYLDIVLDRTPGGTEMIEGVTKWVVPCNWKLAAEQFCSDMYHVPMSHMSAFTAQAPEGLDLSSLQNLPDEGSQFRATWGGHGSGFNTGESGYPVLALTGGQLVADHWYVDTAESANERLGDALATVSGMHMTVFPNLSLLAGLNAFRVWQPRGPNEIEIRHFGLIDKSARPEVKEAYRLGLLRALSPSGIVEQDDAENWVEVQDVLKGHQARKAMFNVQMGLHKDRRHDARFPGNIDSFVSENAARGFYAHWVRMMTESDWSSLVPEVLANAAE
jgi:biphenyl 2,3-dioxygenase alpha subunit